MWNSGSKLLVAVIAAAFAAGCQTGISPVIVLSSRVTIPPGGHQVHLAQCPGGMVATGGGFDTSHADVKIIASVPRHFVHGGTPTGWAVSATNGASFDAGLTVGVVCTKAAEQDEEAAP